MENTAPIADNTQLRLKDIILTLVKYYRAVLSRWYVVALACALFVSYFLYKAFTSPPQYKAELSFMLNSNEGSSLGQIGSLLSQFGVGGGNSDVNLDKIVQLSKSHRIQNTTLFTKMPIDGQEDFLANHIIRNFQLHEKWQKDTTGLNGFLFKTGDFEQFDRLENKALGQIYELLVGKKAVFSCGYDEKSTILSMSLETPNEQLSIYFLRTVFEHLSEFYVLKATERERQNYEILRSQKDSLYSIMRSKEAGAARFEDFNRGLIFNREKVKSDLMRKDAQVATLAYGEILKQFAVADYALKNNTPFIQHIDLPVEPLTPTGKSKVLAILLGLVIGASLSILGILTYDSVKSAMRETT